LDITNVTVLENGKTHG